MIPLAVPPRGVWRVPGSKSITNRALPLAALADGDSRLDGVLESDDTRHMRNGLEALGIEIVDIDDTTWKVRGGRARLRAPTAGEPPTLLAAAAGLALAGLMRSRRRG